MRKIICNSPGEVFALAQRLRRCDGIKILGMRSTGRDKDVTIEASNYYRWRQAAKKIGIESIRQGSGYIFKYTYIKPGMEAANGYS